MGELLDRLDRQDFMRKARSLLLKRVERAGRVQGYMGGPTGGVGMLVGSQPSAGESGAFNERKKNRALYGKYGKGGLERERLGAAEKIAGMEDLGKTARERIKAGSALGVEGRRQKGLEIRHEREYGRGTSYGPDDRGYRYEEFEAKGKIEQDKIDAFRGRTEAWRRQGVKPQFIPGDPDLETGDRMFGLNPRTGRYDISEVPTRKKKKTWKDYDY